MKSIILFLLSLIALSIVSCDTDYEGDISDTFKMYYAVEANDSSIYSLEFYVNNTGGMISLDSLYGNYISDSLVMNVTDADSFYVELENIDGDSLDLMVFKGISIHKFISVRDTGEYVIEGRFNE